MTRRRSQSHTFEEKIAAEKERLIRQADALPLGPEKEAILKKIHQLYTACDMDEWLSSPGLQKPR